jgi:hypothetical protein
MARDLNVKGTAGIVDTDKYVYRQERDLSKTKVDWSEVAKTLTDTIETVRDERETRKAEIEENTRTAMNDFAKFDQYDSKTLNVAIQEGSQWSMNYLSTQNDLVLRGLMSPGEYKIVQQRMQDSWTSLKASLGNADAHFKEMEKRSNAGESNMFEGAINKSLAGFANLKQYELQGNPVTGELGFVKKGADINDPESWLSMGVINQRMNQKSNYVDPIAEASTITQTLGEVVTIKPGTNQSFESYEDWKQMESSQKYIQSFVGAMTATEDKKLSLLQTVGPGKYSSDSFTEDPEEAANDPSKILMRESSDGSGQMEVVLSEAQEKEIQEAAEGILKSQLDEKQSFTKGFQRQPQTKLEGSKEERNRKASGLYNQVVQLVAGDSTSSGQSATSLANTLNDLLPEDASPFKNISRSEDGNMFIAIRQDGSEFKVDRMTEGGERKSNEQIVDELFQKLNPYKETIDVQLAKDAYDKPISEYEFDEETGTYTSPGASSANVETTTYDVIDMASTKALLDDKTPGDYLDTKIGTSFEGLTDSDSQINEVYTDILNNIVPQDLFNDIGGTAALDFNYDGDDATITVGGTTISVTDVRDQSPQAVLKEVEKAVNQERVRLGKGGANPQGGAEGDAYFNN